jgi:hypothetical protein
MRHARKSRSPLPVRTVLVALRRPHLWRPLLTLVPPGWWRRWPPLPIPPGDYLEFRIQTMYGKQGGPLRPADLVAYLEWCRRMTPRSR